MSDGDAQQSPYETPFAREQRLIREAREAAREAAKVEARLEAHDAQFRLLAEQQVTSRSEVSALKQQILDLTAAFRESITIAQTRAEDAQRAAMQQVTSRQLYITALGVTAAILGTLWGGGVLG